MHFHIYGPALASSLAVLLPGVAAEAGNTGIFGGWAANDGDCGYVSATSGVTRDVTAGIITPANVFYHDGQCRVTKIRKKKEKYTLKGVCNEGGGPFREKLKVIRLNSGLIRAKWSGGEWTTYHRCWNLPSNWRELTAAATGGSAGGTGGATSGGGGGGGGIFGGWAASSGDCRYVNTREGVRKDVTAGIITPDFVFYFDGVCKVRKIRKKGRKYILKGLCDEGGPLSRKALSIVIKGENKIRARWTGGEWTTFRRCWRLPSNWRELIAAAQNR